MTSCTHPQPDNGLRIHRNHNKTANTATGRHLDASITDGITIMTGRLFDHAQRRDQLTQKQRTHLATATNRQPSVL
ncbi:hypothetical protein [Paractinoplanes brasiliensis]|uniref:Uncharacterized protein n=1 Tax=Paractinoplanes brasiliensis TaxID=52695 RepID=A0A4R6JZV2_9ACTN|nr:hypothetical protein [Actinoplanes brasiliensis]TDO42424.1 hypothetical protein C8E87_6196 [Actinoplanes brasiliensis]GID29658.1 hypothetical protein Abr02nite_46410 [Actinoplanes brasiliensis]